MVTPGGSPEMASATVPLNPFWLLTAMDVVALAPVPTCTLAGVAESVKLAGAATVMTRELLLVIAPALPETVTVEVPDAAAALACKVSVLVRVAAAGLKVADTPAGRPETAKDTVPLNPPDGVTVMVLALLPPWGTLSVAGAGAMLKPVPAITVRWMVAAPLTLPDVPVKVTVEVPTIAELAAVRVSVLTPVELTALKDAVTPAGRPDAARETAPLKPFWGVIVTLVAKDAPCATLTVDGAAAMVNDGDCVTVIPIRVVPLMLPEVPAMVMVDVPAAAEMPAVRVRMLEVMALAGLKEAVTPVGNPKAARFTALVKPCCALMVMVLALLAPGASETVDAEEDKRNSV